VTFLSIVVPVYNEERFVGELLKRVIAAVDYLGDDFEILVVDDGSTDSSTLEVRKVPDSRIKLFECDVNHGKGAAVRRGIVEASGGFILVQDADLEYDPTEIPRLLDALKSPVRRNCAVYGSRVLGARSGRGIRGRIGLTVGQGLPQWMFNVLLSTFTFFVTRLWVSDLLTGYKIYPIEVFDGWSSQTSGFETDHEITMRLWCLGIEIVEVPISYRPRSRELGKKIGPRDALFAVVTIWRYRKCR